MDKPTVHSKKNNSDNNIFILMHNNGPSKLQGGTYKAECEHEEDRAHYKDDSQAH